MKNKIAALLVAAFAAAVPVTAAVTSMAPATGVAAIYGDVHHAVPHIYGD